MEVRQHVEREEAGGDRHRRVPRDLVPDERAHERIGHDPPEDVAAQPGPRPLAAARLHLPEQEADADEAGEARADRENRERRGHGVPAPVEQQARRQGGQRAGDAHENGAAAEEPAADRLRDEISHPGRPSVVPGDAENGAGAYDGDERGQLRARLDGQEKQQR